MAVNEAIMEAVRQEMNAVRGRLFQCIEAMGLPTPQENAAKGLIRHATYDAQANMEARLRRAT